MYGLILLSTYHYKVPAFGNYYDFQETVKYILNHPDIADIMAKNGHDYVCDNFAWDIMVEKYKRFFKELEEQHAK